MLKYFHIPDDWSPEQAAAVMEFINQLEELIWSTYEEELLYIMGPPPTPTHEDSPPKARDTNDDLPF